MRLISVVLAVMALCCTSAAAQITETGSFSELYDVNRLMFPRDGITYQVSSYDRTGGNDDGFSGKYSFVRKEGEDYVIFDQQGPGCIYRIWSANPGKGRVRFYFDGETTPRIDVAQFEDLFTGGYYPFIKPLTAHFLGGWNSYVPVPFAKSCKIVAQGPVRFLQITWRKFATANGVNTFRRDLPSSERMKLDYAVRAWSSPGEPPVPLSLLSQTVRKQFSSDSGLIELADLKTTGIVRSLKLRLSSEDKRMWRKVLIRMFTDGKKTPDIWSPVGDFFMTGLGGMETRGFLTGVKDGEMYCYFPMPYEKGMRLELVNETGRELTGSMEMVYELASALPKGAMRFNAWWHRQNYTEMGKPFPILTSKGQGHWCGVSHYMTRDRGGIGYLEGDEMLWIDGRDNSHYNGTGTEDYFNCGWYFGAQGCQPLYGCTVFNDAGSTIHAYRIHVTDLVPFKQNARIVIEHGGTNDSPADYAGVTYWYAKPGTTHAFSPVPVASRLLRPSRIAGVTEAESVVKSSHVRLKMMDEYDLNLKLSGGKGVLINANADNKGLVFKLPVSEDGQYDVTAWLVKGPQGGKLEALVDGKPSGVIIDTYAAESEVVKTVVATTDTLPKGEHELSFLSRGKSDAAGGRQIFVDCIRLVFRGMIEAEDLKVINAGGSVDVQDLVIFGSLWGADRHVWFRPDKPASFGLELPVQTAGKYRLYTYLTKAGDYGIVQCKLDGKPLGSPIDCYNDGVVRTPKLDLGVLDLTAGNHEFTVEVTGKNEKSVGFMAGVDCFVLEAVK